MLFDGMQPGRSAATPTFQGMRLFAYINEQATAAFSTHTSKYGEYTKSNAANAAKAGSKHEADTREAVVTLTGPTGYWLSSLLRQFCPLKSHLPINLPGLCFERPI